jgi:hypothetical protein
VRAISDNRLVDRERIERRRIVCLAAVIDYPKRRSPDGALELLFPARSLGIICCAG